VLTDAELKAIWNATGDGKIFSNIIRLLILTGQRRGEIAQLHASWIRDITIPKELTKNGREHTFPCGNFAAELLGKMKPRRPQELYFLARGCSTPFNG
jgi:integrase